MCLAVLQKSDQRVIGFDIFYFNKGGLERNEIHEAYIAVAPDFRSKGLATRMRVIAADHFARGGVMKISTHVMKSNTHSLSSALRVGYTVSEELSDPNGDVTLSLVLDLRTRS
jgi:ribosomal protein S18 acetylase RimI-like enzyme